MAFAWCIHGCKPVYWWYTHIITWCVRAVGRPGFYPGWGDRWCVRGHLDSRCVRRCAHPCPRFAWEYLTTVVVAVQGPPASGMSKRKFSGDTRAALTTAVGSFPEANVDIGREWSCSTSKLNTTEWRLGICSGYRDEI